MSDYIKREDAKQLFLNHMGNEFPQSIKEQIVEKAFEELSSSAEVVEVGKAYPREEFEKYGLSEWKDKHGQRWVMVERREHEKHIHD